MLLHELLALFERTLRLTKAQANPWQLISRTASMNQFFQDLMKLKSWMFLCHLSFTCSLELWITFFKEWSESGMLQALGPKSSTLALPLTMAVKTSMAQLAISCYRTSTSWSCWFRTALPFKSSHSSRRSGTFAWWCIPPLEWVLTTISFASSATSRNLVSTSLSQSLRSFTSCFFTSLSSSVAKTCLSVSSASKHQSLFIKTFRSSGTLATNGQWATLNTPTSCWSPLLSTIASTFKRLSVFFQSLKFWFLSLLVSFLQIFVSFRCFHFCFPII